MVPALVWLLKLAWTIEMRTAVLEDSVSAFAKEAAELRVGIAAAATINQPFQAAIVVFQPKADGDDWRMNVEIWNAAEGKFSILTAKLDKRRKQLLDASLVASIKRTDLDALNFREMQELARIVGADRGLLPQSVNRDDSFIIYADPQEIKEELTSFGFQVAGTRSAKNVHTWQALQEHLERRHRGS